MRTNLATRPPAPVVQRPAGPPGAASGPDETCRLPSSTSDPGLVERARQVAAPPARGTTVRRDSGLWGYERALARHGFFPVAGADEAGRGACAGPLVCAAVALHPGRRGQVPGLADSKLLTPAAREQVYRQVLDRALAWSVVIVPAGEVDARGLHVCNVEGLRRALATLAPAPAYALTDGFPVRGLPVPALAMWKGDRVAACVAAASVVAKVTRDRIMVELSEWHPRYDFAAHKGYVTPEHAAALQRYGPCREHRFSYVNVARVGNNGPMTARLALSTGGMSLPASLPGSGSCP